MTEKIELAPIGEVRNKARRPMTAGWGGVQSEIILYEEVLDCIQGLDGFSHLIILFWMHEVDDHGRQTKRISLSLSNSRRIKLGGLATRTQARPNPIGMSVVRLVSQKDGILKVDGLDAIDGTPVLDVKPYLPPYDAFQNATMPGWAIS